MITSTNGHAPRRFITYSDIHLYGPHEIKVEWNYEKNGVYLGDNVDLVHVPKRKLSEARVVMHYVWKKFEGRSVSGNHELWELSRGPFDGSLYYQIDDVLFTHGDFLAWGDEFACAYRDKKAGGGAVRTFFSGSRWDGLRYVVHPKMTRNFLLRASELAVRRGVKTIVCGHLHPVRLIEKIERGIRILVVPRGKTEILV